MLLTAGMTQYCPRLSAAERSDVPARCDSVDLQGAGSCTGPDLSAAETISGVKLHFDGEKDHRKFEAFLLFRYSCSSC